MNIFYINDDNDIINSDSTEYSIHSHSISREEAYNGYHKMEPKEILKVIVTANSWDEIDEDMYRQMCDGLDMDFDAYEDYASLCDAAAAIIG